MKTESLIDHTPKFPLLAEFVGDSSDDRGTILLFFSEREATVVHAPGRYFKVGSHSQDWSPVYESDQWRICSPGEKVVLTQ